jgi:hypothetical protein
MIEKISANQTSPILGNTPLQSVDPAKSRPANDLDATLQISFADLIEKAKQSPTMGTDAVQEARELLLSGKLTTPENIRSAAQNMLDFGI